MISPRKYIDKMIDSSNTLFGSKPKANISSLLQKGEHPKIDGSELLDEEGIYCY